MKSTFKALVGLALFAGAPAVYAQYSLTLTGVGNGTVSDGVYVTPYVGTVQSGATMLYSGYIICDDFNTESYLNSTWSATSTNAGALDGSEKFTSNVTFNGVTYSAQQAYDAAAFLANGLLGNLNNQTTQVGYAFAIWNLFDGQQSSNALSLSLEQSAFDNVKAGYVGNNVSVFTPNPLNASQEFLVVNRTATPEINSASAAAALTLLLGGVLVLRGRRQPRLKG